MGDRAERPDPLRARSARELVACMRQLKEWSGLTYRQLSARSERAGDVLPSSTLADTLTRSTMPRAEVLGAFVRACGCDRDEVAVWLSVRTRICEAAVSPAGDEAVGWPPEEHGPGPDEAPAPRPPAPLFRERHRILAVAGALAVVLGVAGLLAFQPGGEDGARPPAVTDSGRAPHSAASCRGAACRDEDPELRGCLYDGRHVSGVKTQLGLVDLFHSSACQALWAEVSNDPSLVSVYLKSDSGVALTVGRDRLHGTASSQGTMVRTPMLPSEDTPRHAEVCVAYRELEACTGSDGMTRVRPYPTSEPSAGGRQIRKDPVRS
ncbi:helix-turn-helix domain-containing protein [Streptomyces glomeratus]|uniref:HTH cro/C1-type domain-containing protein n=1 Tax=Streptomyces glomeratus TaxID=284452 RepID=A0ABP6LIA5_9ACTN|nr:helix-turn-helix transcriptional regulator [Streptomyces glomeratus]MCF1511930.1 helix-turn-helix domain-containing protein [Streptomyces glomeratus]